MTQLVTTAQLRTQVQTALTDDQLNALIQREEAEIVRRYGAHYVDVAALTPVTETLKGLAPSVWVNRQVESVYEINEKATLAGTLTTVSSSDYYAWIPDGRIQRLSGLWGEVVVVEYKPQDDSDSRRQAIIELVRLALSRTALKSESIGGEYSYSAPDWLKARVEIHREFHLYRTGV